MFIKSRRDHLGSENSRSQMYQFDRLPSPPPGTPGLLHRNVCPAPGLLHNRKCPGAGPMKDDVPGAGHLYQLAFKHENC